MALTEITTKSVKDGEIIDADISGSAAIAKSKLAALDIVNADINASAAIAKSKLGALGIVNADVDNSAAIAKSKLASLEIGNADVASDAAIAKSKLAALAIANADVDASAAIAGSKISPDFGAQAIVTTGSISGRHGRAPTNTQGSTYTLVATDAGKIVKAAGNVTIDQNVFADGDMLVVYNSSGGDITLIQGTSFTLRLAGDAATGTRTIAQKGICTVFNLAANEAVAGGVGVS